MDPKKYFEIHFVNFLEVIYKGNVLDFISPLHTT